MIRRLVRFCKQLIGLQQAEDAAHDLKNQITSQTLSVQHDLEQANRVIKKTTAYKLYLSTRRET